MSDTPTPPTTQFAFEARVRVEEGRQISAGDRARHFTPITGGTVAGPMLNGSVLPGGGDWSVQRGDTTRVDAHYLLEADDGGIIDVRNVGYFRASPEVVARHEAGEQVGDDEFYFRTAPTFVTGAPAHQWLAEHQFVGVARDEDEQICIRFFVVR